MPLPSTVVNINSANWSDHLNSFHKPVQRLRYTGLFSGEDVQRNVGDSAANEMQGQKNAPIPIDTPIPLVLVKIKKVGNPTDGLVAKLYQSDANGAGALPGTLVATSIEVKASQMSTTSQWNKFWFLQPYTGAMQVFHLAISRTGSYDAANYYQIECDSTSADLGSGAAQTRLNNGTWSEINTSRLMLMAHVARAEYYTFAIDRTNNKLRCYSSTDGGLTWTEKDSANAPSVLSTATLRSICVNSIVGEQFTYVARAVSTTQLSVRGFDMHGNAWSTGVDQTLTVAAFNTNVSGQAPLFGFWRQYFGGVSAKMAIYQGATESNMGTPYRRIKLTVFVGGSTSTYDVVGSTNTPNSTLPGTAVHYDLRSAFMDDLGNAYIFYTQSDDSLLRLRIYKSNDTFCTILNPASAASSNSANYPVGLGTSFWRDGENYVGLPYVDGSSTKVITAKAGTDAETAGNWTAATAVASAAEVAASNPATLVPDNDGGGKLFLFRVRTDKTIGLCDDGAVGTWSTETDWRSGQSVAGISGGALLNAPTAGITYLDTVPATDELKHDHL